MASILSMTSRCPNGGREEGNTSNKHSNSNVNLKKRQNDHDDNGFNYSNYDELERNHTKFAACRYTIRVKGIQIWLKKQTNQRKTFFFFRKKFKHRTKGQNRKRQRAREIEREREREREREFFSIEGFVLGQ